MRNVRLQILLGGLLALLGAGLYLWALLGFGAKLPHP